MSVDLNLWACSLCGEIKPPTGFYMRSPSSGGGRCSECKECSKKRSRETGRKRRARDPEGHLASYRKWAYGLTAAAFDALHRAQDGACAMCSEPFGDPRKAHVDHCHDTGEVRGLLCHGCNHVLGMANDRPEVLRAGIDYLAEPPAAAVLAGCPAYVSRYRRYQRLALFEEATS